MPKEVLQITITSRKASKYKLVRWLQHKWFIVWCIWKPKLVSKICWVLSEAILKILPKEEADKLRKEYEEIEVHIVNKMEDGN
jgi:hypothetical protein